MPSPGDLIDWQLARRVGSVVGGPGPSVDRSVKRSVHEDFAELSTLSDELVRGFTGLEPATEVPAPVVVDRAGWIDANIDSFGAIVGPLEDKIRATVKAGAISRKLTSAALGVQMGILLGYLSQKVLGQYDLVLASEAAGRVYYVGPNIVEAERRWSLQPRDFRLWIALHEVTHRTQFTGVPWLKDKVRSLVTRSVEAVDLGPERVRALIARGRDLVRGGPGAWRRANIIELFMSPEQRVIIGEMQALMTVVEGHGTFVMNRLGEERIPSWATMRDAVEKRRKAGSAERAFQRAIGMDLKYEQYTLGERFCNEVADRAGLGAVNRLWDAEENLPTLDDLRDPDAWLARVGG